MSYINDALNKAQKEKESSNASYGGVVSVNGKKPGARKKWILAIGLIAVSSLAAGIAALLYWPDATTAFRPGTVTRSPGIVTAEPVKGLPAPRLMSLTEIAALQPANIEGMPPSESVRTPEVKEKKQNAGIPVKELKRAAVPVADTETLYRHALQKQREGKLLEAKDLYGKVIEQEPHNIQALNNLGVIYLKLKRYEWASLRFNDALKIKHDYADAHYNLACLHAQKNDTKKSLFYLKNAVGLDPGVRQWAIGDEDLKNLASLPEFNKIMQAQDK